MSATSGKGFILGGLPVWVEIESGKDSDTPNGPGEFWSEVQAIHWLKRDGTPGKALPPHIADRAEKYDPYFCDLIEYVFDQELMRRHVEETLP